jgi:hypothetical protein
VGVEKSLLTQISESFISMKIISFILIELLVIGIEFFVSRSNSIEWFKFFLLKNYSAEPQNRAEFYAAIKKLSKETNLSADVSRLLTAAIEL